jgi:flagellar hook protein FlgE
MNTDSVSNKPRARVVDCIVVTSEVHNKDSGNKEAPSRSEPPKKLFRPSKNRPEYTDTIKKRVQLLNKDLSLKNKSYRYNTRQDGDKLFVDMFVMDSHGDIVLQYTKEVTQDNYRVILDSMQSGSGFLFDD